MTDEKEITVKEEKKEFVVVDVTSQTEPVMQTPEGELVTDRKALAMILNELKEIKNLVG